MAESKSAALVQLGYTPNKINSSTKDLKKSRKRPSAKRRRSSHRSFLQVRTTQDKTQPRRQSERSAMTSQESGKETMKKTRFKLRSDMNKKGIAYHDKQRRNITSKTIFQAIPHKFCTLRKADENWTSAGSWLPAFSFLQSDNQIFNKTRLPLIIAALLSYWRFSNYVGCRGGNRTTLPADYESAVQPLHLSAINNISLALTRGIEPQFQDFRSWRWPLHQCRASKKIKLAEGRGFEPLCPSLNHTAFKAGTITVLSTFRFGTFSQRPYVNIHVFHPRTLTDLLLTMLFDR